MDNIMDHLKNKYERLQKELSELKEELRYVQSGRKSDPFINTRRTTERVYMLDEPEKQRTNNRYRRETYELLTGVAVDSVTVRQRPGPDEAGWLQFEVAASINELRFGLSYLSRGPGTAAGQVRDLRVRVTGAARRGELRAALRHWASAPAGPGLAVLCLKDYERLSTVRQRVHQQLVLDEPRFIQCRLITDTDNEDQPVHLEMTIAHEGTAFVLIKWFIVWNDNLLTVTDKFEIQIQTEDEEFLNSTSHNFEKLTRDKSSKVTFVDLNNDELNNDEAIQPEALSEIEKLAVFRNIVLAAKAST